MLFAMVTGTTAFLGKIAHDEAFDRYSPGVLLILEATRTLLARTDITSADSCAVPGHPMIDNIWRDRVPLADMLIAAPGTPPPLLRRLPPPSASAGRSAPPPSRSITTCEEDIAMPLIELDRSTARASFHRAPFAMRHTLAGHDLFTLPRLVELAKSMPRDRIEYNSGKLEPGVRPEEVPGIAMPAEDVIRRIENADAWLVIKGVERDPAYRALLHEFLTEVSSAAGPATERFEDLQGFIFVSSAGSVTPFHFDAEENILVQIRGDKYVHIFDNADRSLVPEESLELSPANIATNPIGSNSSGAPRSSPYRRAMPCTFPISGRIGCTPARAGACPWR